MLLSFVTVVILHLLQSCCYRYCFFIYCSHVAILNGQSEGFTLTFPQISAHGISKAPQECLFMIVDGEQGTMSVKYKLCAVCVTLVLPKCYPSVTIVLPKCYPSVTLVLPKCYPSVTLVLPLCYPNVIPVLS